MAEVTDNLATNQHGGVMTRTFATGPVVPWTAPTPTSTRPTTGQLWPRGDSVP